MTFGFHSIETCGHDWMTNLSRRTFVCLQPSAAVRAPSGQNVLFPLALKLTLNAQILGCLPGQHSSVLSKSRASCELRLLPRVLLSCPGWVQDTFYLSLYSVPSRRLSAQSMFTEWLSVTLLHRRALSWWRLCLTGCLK